MHGYRINLRLGGCGDPHCSEFTLNTDADCTGGNQLRDVISFG